LSDSHGVIARHQHPELRASLEHLLRRQELTTVLPGIYTVPSLAARTEIKIRAAMLRHPDGVLFGASAAQVSYWPEMKPRTIDLAVPSMLRPAVGFRFSRRRIPAELVVQRDGLRFTDPALTAVDLATFECADAIDVALRTRTATLDGMYEALRLTPNRWGNTDRRRLLVDSRNEPWSAAERLAHRELRACTLTGWQTNWPVVISGLLYYIDIAFPAQKLAIEIDGRLHETKEDLFQSDRWRQNALVLAGWRVIRFTWEMLRDHPQLVIATIRHALRP
jgi:very-short-patch-repair endonuclease